MAYLDLNERAVIAVTSRLTNSLNGYIDLVNATTTGDPTRNQTQIAYPRQILDAPPVMNQLSMFPTLAVGEGIMEFEDDIGWTATGLYDMVALAYVTSPDPEALAWQLRRYAQALASAVLFGRQMDAGGWGVVLKRIVPGKRLSRFDPKTKQPTGEIMSWVQVEFLVKDEQFES